MAKIHLTAQIMEIERELDMRHKVYPGWVSRGKMRQSEADLHMEQMQAVRETLIWVQANMDGIKQFISSKE